MTDSLLLLVFLGATIVCAVAARRFSLPYPIVFALGGAGLALIPGTPRPTIHPDLIFTVILPPLLFSGGWATDWAEFKRNRRPIAFLAVGLVVATTAVVAIAAHRVISGLPWAAAFALGAIISPPDAVAASAVFERFKVPRRIVAILEGEGLLNDATALVIYRFAVAAVVTQQFSPLAASTAFVAVAAGGVALGLAIAFALESAQRLLSKLELADSLVDNLVFLIAPYATYLPADALGLSGVLSTVTAGLYLSRRSSVIYPPETRLIGGAVWQLLNFAFNGFLFMIIGLELPGIVSDPATLAPQTVGAAVILSAIVIAVRIAWVFPATYLPRYLNPRIAASDPAPSWRYVCVIAWSGLRGTISLAAALALPLAIAGGGPFPERNEIIFVTFCVIFATLIVQGISLGPIIRLLGIEDGPALRRKETQVRIKALEAGLARLRAIEPSFTSTTEWEVAGRLSAEYQYRIAHLRGHAEGDGPETDASRIDHRFEAEALDAERREIMRLRDEGSIPDEVFRKIEYDLDLAAARLT